MHERRESWLPDDDEGKREVQECLQILQSPWKTGSQHLCLEVSVLSKIGECCTVSY